MYYLIVLLFLNLSEFSEAGSNLRLDGRIIGGEDADIKDFPYQLSMRYQGSHFCGASIISENWVLTAAHCVEDVASPYFLEIHAGSSYMHFGGTRHSVIRIVSHENYNRDTLDYDIAVLLVRTPFVTWNKTFNEQPIGLPNFGEIPIPGSMATTSGWGITAQGSSDLPNQLKSVEVPIVSHVVCVVDYPYETVTDRMVCAGYRFGGKDTCQGDSGGPLVQNGKQIGIVSWGEGCASPNSPGVYTNVASLRLWILQQTNI